MGEARCEIGQTKLITAMALLILIGRSGSDGANGEQDGIAAALQIIPNIPEAPSATVSRAPIRCLGEKLKRPGDPLNKENAALDRKIRSICRGC